MQRFNNSPRPASVGSVHSQYSNRDRGPRPSEDVCIGEEVRIGINLAVDKFRMNESQKELEFPSSLTATERAFIHRLCDTLGMKSRSKGKGCTRYLTIYKKYGTQSSLSLSMFQLVRNSSHQIHSVLQRYPLTSKERQELQPRVDRSQNTDVAKELNKTGTGRLNNGVAQVPPLRGGSELDAFRQSLPIQKLKEDILHDINHNSVVLISGETGSGKTTQVPQMILDDCHANNRACRIFCTQPRRIAALSIAERVSTERGEKLGQTVGYQIRLESRVSPKTLLTFCTNGVLLRTLMGGHGSLSTVTHVIVDEVHERDRFSDFLLTSIRDLLPKYRHLKLILMSAALHIELFVNYFNHCPVVHVPGTLYGIQEFFLEDILKWTGYTNQKMQKFTREQPHMIEQQKHLTEWYSQKLPPTENRPKEQDESALPNDITIAVSSSEDQEEDRENLEPWLAKELDQLMSDVWLSGNEDVFSQIFHLIISEHISVDYQHIETSASPLMVAAGRGFLGVVEQLLNMGANVNLRASNNFTALDWAKQFGWTDIVELLEAHLAASEVGNWGDGVHEKESELISVDDKALLSAYQHSFDDDKVDLDLIMALLIKIITSQQEGAILVFLPGYDDIVTLRGKINEDKNLECCRYILYLLHSSLQSSDQKRVFRTPPPGVRKIILATNIAETSITINDVVFVINSGKVKEKTFDALSSTTMLKSNWISKASALQRKGRSGRCRPGICYHMFSKIRYSNLQTYPTPEILRLPLQELCLHTKLLAPPNCPIADYLARAPEAPAFLVCRNAIQILNQMGALDAWEDLTELGHHLTDLPVDPRLGKMVLYSVVLKCLDPILTIACVLAYKDPFVLPSIPSQKRAAHAARQKFSANTYSDTMALLRAFQAWQKARTDGVEKSFCENNFLSSATMEMIVGLRTQLLGQLRASGFVRARGGGDIRDLNTNSENWAVVKAALCAGMYPNILKVDKIKKKLVTQKESDVRFHSGSVLNSLSSTNVHNLGLKAYFKSINLPSTWIVYDEMTRFQKFAFVKCCTLVSPVAVALLAGPSKLPSDCLKGDADPQENGQLDFHDNSSDSECGDHEDNKKAILELDDWLAFKLDNDTASLVLQLRHKWNSLLLRRLRAPSKPCSQIDEAIVRCLVSVLTNEEQALGLQQPAGIGQRPRPMTAESVMSGGWGKDPYDNYDCQEKQGNKYGRRQQVTPPRKSSQLLPSQVTPPSKSYQQLPRTPKYGDDKSGASSPHSNNSNSLRGSTSSTPCLSPQSDTSRWSEKDPGATSDYPCRYFIMKCNNQKNLDISLNKGIWATSASNERKLNKAFQDGKVVHLIFSIQGSGHFQGYGKMTSPIVKEKSQEFTSPGLSGNFSIDWIKRDNIPFQATHQLLNPWNEGKKVQISRDGQELEPTVGEVLVNMWDTFSHFQKSQSPQWHKPPKQNEENIHSPRGQSKLNAGSTSSHSSENRSPASYNLQGQTCDQGHYPEATGHHPYGQGRNVQSGRHNTTGHYPQHTNGSSAQIHNHGLFTHQGMNYQQMGSGFNMGPIGNYPGVVMPPGSAVSPHRGMSPIMILQRNSQGQQHQSFMSSHHQGQK